MPRTLTEALAWASRCARLFSKATFQLGIVSGGGVLPAHADRPTAKAPTNPPTIRTRCTESSESRRHHTDWQVRFAHFFRRPPNCGQRRATAAEREELQGKSGLRSA